MSSSPTRSATSSLQTHVLFLRTFILPEISAQHLRRSFASRALVLGEALPVIGKQLGHSDIETTARYAYLVHDSIHETAERIAGSIANEIL